LFSRSIKTAAQGGKKNEESTNDPPDGECVTAVLLIQAGKVPLPQQKCLVLVLGFLFVFCPAHCTMFLFAYDQPEEKDNNEAIMNGEFGEKGKKNGAPAVSSLSE